MCLAVSVQQQTVDACLQHCCRLLNCSCSLPAALQLRAGNVLGDALEGEEAFDAIHVGAGI